MKLFLIGMPGSGKSSVGVCLAKKMSLPFFDLDTLIIRKEGKAISQIFEDAGEDYFRKVEADCLMELIGSTAQFVCATGGGAPCFLDNFRNMTDAGTVVFLDVPLNELKRRLEKQSDVRPLLNENLNLKLEKLYNERRLCYSKAAVHVNAAGSEEEVAEAIGLEVKPK